MTAWDAYQTVIHTKCCIHTVIYTRQSCTQNNKYLVSHRHSYFFWWWAHSCPKHVDKRNILRKIVHQVGLIYKNIQGCRSTKHKTQFTSWFFHGYPLLTFRIFSPDSTITNLYVLVSLPYSSMFWFVDGSHTPISSTPVVLNVCSAHPKGSATSSQGICWYICHGYFEVYYFFN